MAQPGAPIVRIVQMDKLRVEGMLNIKDFGPDQIANPPVKVMAQVGPNRVEEFQGKVVFIDPELIKGGKYRVLAEVVNRCAEGDGPGSCVPACSPKRWSSRRCRENRRAPPRSRARPLAGAR